jgi:hypothetical protein
MAKPETPRKATKTPAKAQTPKPIGLEPKKTGRPSKYTPEIAQEMCNLLADGVPLREICRKEGFPAWQTVYDWMVRDDKAVASGGGVGLSVAIARAREMGYDSLAEECLSIADDASNDWMERLDKDGQPVGWMLNGDHVQRSKLRIETRLKLLAKWDPKRFGDRVQLAGDAENPVKVEVESQAEKMMAALLQNIELKRQDGSR